MGKKKHNSNLTFGSATIGYTLREGFFMCLRSLVIASDFSNTVRDEMREKMRGTSLVLVEHYCVIWFPS